MLHIKEKIQTSPYLCEVHCPVMEKAQPRWLSLFEDNYLFSMT